MSEPITILCSKCGAPMKSNERYCMKCGELNYEHPDNKNMRKFQDKRPIKMGGNRFIASTADTGRNTDLSSNSRLCIIFNIVLLVLLIGFGIWRSLPIYYYLLSCVGMLLLFSVQVLYIKWDKPFIIALVPIFGQIIFYEKTMGSSIYFLLSLIPGVGFVVSFIALYKLGVQYNFNGWLSALLAPIMIPVMALNKKYPDVPLNSLPDKNGVTQDEKNYKINHYIFSILIIILLVIIAYYAFPYIKDIYYNFLKYLKNS